MPHTVEASFEAQLEELTERLHDCLRPDADDEAMAAQGILRELIAGYQLELSALRRLDGRELERSSLLPASRDRLPS